MKRIEIHNGGGLENLKVVEREKPTPAAGQVLVQWHATSLNYHDYLVGMGAIPVEEGRVPMSDGAGEIVALGDGVEDWKVGDRVMSLFFPDWQNGDPSFASIKNVSGESINGYLTEYSCLSENAITHIPKDYSFADAACLPCAAVTAWNGLIHSDGFKNGDSVLIEGTGGMSIFGLQIALAKSCKVYATSSSPVKISRLKEMGVQAVVNYKEDERWGKSIFKLSDGGVQHILDVGGGSTMQQSIEAATIGGNICSIGILGDGRKGMITFPKLFFKFIKMRGIAVGSRAMQNDLVSFLETSDIKPIIDKSFGFDQLADAFRYQESGQHFGKIVLEW